MDAEEVGEGVVDVEEGEVGVADDEEVGEGAVIP